MTVEQLIAALREHPPYREVRMHEDGWAGVPIRELKLVQYDGKAPVVEIR